MNEITNKILSDIRTLRTQGNTWEAPEWALTKAKQLGCQHNHPKVIEYGLFQVIEEFERSQMLVEAEIEAKVESRVADRLRAMGHKVSEATSVFTHQASVFASQTTNKIKSLASSLMKKSTKEVVQEVVAPPAE